MEPVDHFLSKMKYIFSSRDKINDVLFVCIQHLIIRPRYHLISLINVLCDKMKLENFNESNVTQFLEETKRWVLSTKNKNFTKNYYIQHNNTTTIKIPEHIKNLFLKFFDKNIDILINKYVQTSDNETIGQYIDAYVQNWRNPVNMVDHVVSNRPVIQEEDPDKPVFKRGRNESGTVGGTGDIAMVEGGNYREFQKLKRVQDNINLHYKKGMREIKKADQERFVKIFEELNIVDPKLRGIISKIWYGDINSENIEDNNIINVIKKKKIKSKISNYNIRSVTNRLILQSYIAGLMIGKTVYEIFTVINRIDPDVTPRMIYNKGKPNSKIQEILNNIISEIYLDPTTSEIYLRDNWEKIKNPTINIEKLVDYIQNTKDIHDKNKYIIINRINDIDKQTSIEKFTKEVHNIIKDISLKNITEANILNNLRYY